MIIFIMDTSADYFLHLFIYVILKNTKKFSRQLPTARSDTLTILVLFNQ